MRQRAFEEVLEEVRNGREAQLSFEAGGVEYIRKWIPRERLVILGGGHIALSLCRMAALAGFSITVADNRPEFAVRERFPSASQVLCGDFGDIVDSLALCGTDYVCVATNGHMNDALCLRHVLSGEMPRYLGMIGSHKRAAALLDTLEREGFPRKRLESIHAPIGLPIKAQTPAEIAVSILAQLIECRRRDFVKAAKNSVLSDSAVDLPLLEALASGAGKQMAAVVISAQGSTPTRSGAMMSVDFRGNILGTVGGGSAEGQVIRQAMEMFGSETKRPMTVDMHSENISDMACGGSMTALIEAVE